MDVVFISLVGLITRIASVRKDEKTYSNHWLEYANILNKHAILAIVISSNHPKKSGGFCFFITQSDDNRMLRFGAIFILFIFCGAYGALPQMPLCDGGYPVATASDDGYIYTCQEYTQNTCVSGYGAVNTLGVGPSQMDGTCSNTITAINTDAFYINNSARQLCDGGYDDGAGCVKYAPDIKMCPQDYNKISESADVMLRRVDDDIACPAKFAAIPVFDDSHHDDVQATVWGYPYTTVPDSMLALRMCPWGQEMNHLGDCVNLCPWESRNSYMRYLRTSTGLIVPIYATKVTSPSLNLQVENTRCYVNLLQGRKAGTINLQIKDEIWHVVD